MSKNKKVLNKGLESLLGDFGAEAISSNELEKLSTLSVSLIVPGKYQPRKKFDELALKELGESILEHGIIQPIVVREIHSQKYEIIAGERRYRAAQIAGLTELPCIIKNYDDEQALAVALIENLQRSDLNALEVAEGFYQLIHDFKLTHEKISQLVGRSRSSITNFIRLLDLDEYVKAYLRKGEIEMGHARALLTLDVSSQKKMVDLIVSQKLSVRQTEAKVKLLQSEKAVEKRNDPNTEVLAQALSEFLGQNITISHSSKGKGKIIVKYNNLDELDKIIHQWGYKK